MKTKMYPSCGIYFVITHISYTIYQEDMSNTCVIVNILLRQLHIIQSYQNIN